MTNLRKPLAGLLALGFAVATPMAFAQDAGDAAAQPQAQGQTSWSDLDTDGDGNLSREEAAAMPQLAQVFDQADADGDGVLTPQEYQQYAESQGAGSPPPQDDGL